MSNAEIEELTKRLARLEDERAIVATLYAYGTALDYGDRQMFMECFTPDADYVVDMRIVAEGGFEFHGYDELRGYFDGHTHAPTAYHKHVTVNPSITVDGDTASASSYFLRVDAAADSGPATVLASGRYTDELVRGENGRWLIRSRRCEVENL